MERSKRSTTRHIVLWLPAAAAMWLSLATPSAQQLSGEAVYKARWAGCHDQVTPRVPNREALAKMSSARILRPLDFGVMMPVAYPLRRDERSAVASYLGTTTRDPEPPAAAFCRDRTVRIP